MSTLRVNNITDTSGGSTNLTVPNTAKAWVYFDGTFGTSPFTIGNGGIRASFNVSSITDNGTGDYTVNFTNALADSEYAYALGASGNQRKPDFIGSHFETDTKTTSAFRVAFGYFGALDDYSRQSVIIFR